MTTANAITTAEQMIHQRLDAIDRALLGWLPRSERLALVAQVEARARELAAGATPDSNLAGTANCLELADPPALPGASPMSTMSAPAFPSACRRRSGMAIAAGILGIVALVLLFFTPVSYLIAGFLGDVIGEVGAISLLGVHLGIVTLGGLAAVGLGTAALVQMKRRRGTLGGHGWAITGLCTGPWPLLGGAVVGIIMGVEMIGSTTMSASVSEEDGTTATASYSAPEGIYLNPSTGLPVPACMPAPVASNPSSPRCMPAQVPSDPSDPRLLVPPDPLPRQDPPVQPPIQTPADELPSSESEARPEPPAVP
jgi:hypothetical protein